MGSRKLRLRKHGVMHYYIDRKSMKFYRLNDVYWIRKVLGK